MPPTKFRRHVLDDGSDADFIEESGSLFAAGVFPTIHQTDEIFEIGFCLGGLVSRGVRLLHPLCGFIGRFLNALLAGRVGRSDLLKLALGLGLLPLGPGDRRLQILLERVGRRSGLGAVLLGEVGVIPLHLSVVTESVFLARCRATRSRVAVRISSSDFLPVAIAANS